jgi:hypothetical protein
MARIRTFIKVETTNCSREEVEDLETYLEDNCWKHESYDEVEQ